MARGKSVRLFLVDGTPGGLITAEIMNWTGHVIAVPRSELATLLQRREVDKTGIYVLLGDDPDSPGSTLAYIGEGGSVYERLRAHARSDNSRLGDFWDRAVVLVSKDTNLTKAHARYLESRFFALATEAGRARLLNGKAPRLAPLPEADRSDMEYFIDQARIVLPVLGVNLLRLTKPASVTDQDDVAAGAASPMFILASKKTGVDATAQEVDGEFVVREGSLVRSVWSADDRHSYEKLRFQLEQDGTLRPLPEGTGMEFTRDQAFASPSAAAACVLGRPANGRSEWKVADSRMTYGQWQESLLDAVVTDE
ncbi:GIY-YIG nuclease family protein [Haloechinothrix sp. LS1_15]|uniref:GIY-YIG nuclease family protein n=1 Tax=Haloechinothrix sp. LS1_15 TaxID=2652248 RepID=UPI0029476663|nr:GIY-YIG nuclease family protein [Haloechinothrix sp. LS1_15]MDV6012543.1 GIY-YIG nuclease family protein [Haloechinothrix sp. LS1_15]